MKHSVWLFILCMALLLTAGCGKPSDPPSVSEEGITALSEAQTAPSALPEDKVTCSALEKDGEVYGFELRFRRSDDTDALLRAPENYYYGVLTCGKKTVAVPTEQIRLLNDVPSGTFVATLLLPRGETISAKECTVSLCIAPREAAAQEVLFCVSKTVPLA